MNPRAQAQMLFGKVMLEKVRRDRYPSATEMTLLEENLTPQLAQEYFEVLLEKVVQDRWPSITMMRRVARVAQSLPAQDRS